MLPCAPTGLRCLLKRCATTQHGAAAGGVLCRRTLSQMIHLCPELFLIRPGVDPQDESLLTLHLEPPPSHIRPGKAVLISSSDEDNGGGAGEVKQPAGKARAARRVGEAAAAAAATAAVVPRKRHRSSSENTDLRQVSFE